MRPCKLNFGKARVRAPPYSGSFPFPLQFCEMGPRKRLGAVGCISGGSIFFQMRKELPNSERLVMYLNYVLCM